MLCLLRALPVRVVRVVLARLREEGLGGECVRDCLVMHPGERVGWIGAPCWWKMGEGWDISVRGYIVCRNAEGTITCGD